MNKLHLILATAACSGLQAYALPTEETLEDSTRVKDIEEIVIVSSPKETGKLRHAPVSASLFDPSMLADRHTSSLKELSEYVPNFYMPDYGSSLTSAAYIRGIGSRINTPAVGLYVDNVGYADKSAYDIELLDVERIDVMRGPQATLYGRNAMGGLLRVFTRNRGILRERHPPRTGRRSRNGRRTGTADMAAGRGLETGLLHRLFLPRRPWLPLSLPGRGRGRGKHA